MLQLPCTFDSPPASPSSPPDSPRPSPRPRPTRSCLRKPPLNTITDDEATRVSDALLLRFLFCDYIIPVIYIILPGWLLHFMVQFLLDHYRVYQEERKNPLHLLHRSKAVDKLYSESDEEESRRQLKTQLKQALSREDTLRQTVAQMRNELEGEREARRVAEECWARRKQEYEDSIRELSTKLIEVGYQMPGMTTEELDCLAETALNEEWSDEDEEAEETVFVAVKQQIQCCQANQATVASVVLALDDIATKYGNEGIILAAVARSLVADTDGWNDQWAKLFHPYLGDGEEKDARMDVILEELEQGCEGQARRFRSLVLGLYKRNVVDADAVDRWFSSSGARDLQRLMAPFVRWLQDDSSCSSDEDMQLPLSQKTVSFAH